MNTNRGIFDIFAKPAPTPQQSPFSIADESEPQKPEEARKPFDIGSPFESAGETPGPAKLESPFSVAEPAEGFGFEAPAKPSLPQSPVETTPVEFPALTVPVSPLTSPFNQASETAFRSWQEPAPVGPTSTAPLPSVSALGADFLTDSTGIRQLELRAIFGVDRELSADEMLQRARGLSGVRHVSRVADREVVAIESLNNLLGALGLQGPLKLHAGNIPVDFIREGNVLLAVQTDGAYAPGVRETLMIIARELGRQG